MKTLYALVKLRRGYQGTFNVEEVAISFSLSSLEQEGREWMGVDADPTDSYYADNTYAIEPVTLGSEITNALKGIAVPWVDPAIVGALAQEGRDG
jgi:hypothetical protein